MKSPGHVVWLAHKNVIDPGLPKRFLDSEWDSMHPKWKEAWEAAYQAAIDARPCVHPQNRISYYAKKSPEIGNDEIVYLCTECGKKL